MRLLSSCLVMESGSLDLKTSSSTRRISLAILGRSSESPTLIPFTHRYATSFFFQLDRWDGTLEFHKGRGKIRPTLTVGTPLAWKNTFAIASTFALSMSSPITTFWLASSFRHMSVSLGQLLSRSVWVNLPPGRTILGWSFIKAWQMLSLQMWTPISTTWAGEPFFLLPFLVAHVICSSSVRMPWPSIDILVEETFSLP